LRVLDGAILVLSGVEGVQSQSITVDRQMRRYNVPRLAFINKLDRAGANHKRVLESLKEKLKLNAVFTQLPIGLEDNHKGVIDLVKMKAYFFHGENGETIEETEIPAELKDEAESYRADLIAAAADCDDIVGEKFLMEEEITNQELMAAIRKGTIELKLVPVFLGSAFKNKGVQLLLDGVGDYLPNPTQVKNEALDLDKNEEKQVLESNPDKPLVMLAFKLEDGRYGQLTYMRIYQGTVKKGDTIVNTTNDKKLKVPRLVRMHSNDMEDITEASCGDIIAMFGVDCASGDTFTDGTVNMAMTSMHVADPVISLAIAPKDKSGSANFSKALNKFTKEDPTFRVHRDEESGETIISGMGELHLEVYVERMKREFSVEVVTGKPQVAYREAITQRADFVTTHKKQTGGAGQFAKIGGFVEPLPLDGPNYEFSNKIVGGVIPREYIPACDKGFQEQINKGILIGAPVIGVKVEINDGSFHAVDSSEMAFKICAMTAMREVLPQAGLCVLEPIMKVEVSAPEEFQGSVMGQINQRRGMIQGSTSNEGFAVVEAEVPLTEMFGYSTDLRSATQGKGEFTMEFSRYTQAPRSVQEELVKAYQKKRAEENK
ncbi:MAG: elongation factor G, partial [Bdellovibrionales bacterium]|nr:elongation factor G [Bdellovibrionales bacterium]